METLDNKVAVVTGAASGMGLAFAHRFARAGMKVVMSDIEAPVLENAAAAVRGHGGDVLAVVTDVSDAASMDELAAATFDAFDTAHVICNNAGVAGSLGRGELDAARWKWVIDVNLWGVIHGHRVFLPRLIEQDEGHIVNTASMAGHFPGHSAYTASKWAVTGLTMGLFNQLAASDSNVSASCLCPGWVRTGIAESSRNMPEWAAPNALAEPNDEEQTTTAFVKDAIAAGMEPDDVAEMVHDAIIDQRLWIFTHPEMVAMLANKHDSIMTGQNPEIFGLVD